jgi:leader peptidase (prepilin peptidase)/N-methyltransferase
VLAIIVLGLVVGSFLNVCIWRLPRRESLLGPRSRCSSCGRSLGAWELIPLLSYAVLGGRCRTCRAGISPVYPLVEAGNAALYVLSVFVWGWSLQALSAAVFGSLLIVSGIVDARHQIIPDAVTIPGLGLGLVLSIFNPQVGPVSALIGLLLGGGLLLAMATVTNGGMGGGDIKFAAMMGAFLGWTGLLSGLLIGFLGGAVVGLVLMLTGVKRRGDVLAFGPFLAVGGLVAAFWGPVIAGWYVALFWG